MLFLAEGNTFWIYFEETNDDIFMYEIKNSIINSIDIENSIPPLTPMGGKNIIVPQPSNGRIEFIFNGKDITIYSAKTRDKFGTRIKEIIDRMEANLIVDKL